MRARRSSRSASGISIVNGRTVVSPVDVSVMTAMWVLLGGDGGEVTARSVLVSSAHIARREPWVAHGVHTGVLTGPFAGLPLRGRLGSCEGQIEVVGDARPGVADAEITARVSGRRAHWRAPKGERRVATRCTNGLSPWPAQA